MRIFSHKKRAVHLGPFPLEDLQRSDEIPQYQSASPQTEIHIEDQGNSFSLANAMREYIDLFDSMRFGDAAPDQAPIPDDPQERANNLKAGCYFIDTSMAATCKISESCFLQMPVVNQSLSKTMEGKYKTDSAINHSHALVILQEFTREPEKNEPGGEWLVGTQVQRAAIRAAEVAAVMVNYIRMLGFEACIHTAMATELGFDQILLCSGLGVIDGEGEDSKVVNPYLQDQFGMAIVSTNMVLASDRPLKQNAWRGLRWWLGMGGSRPGYLGKLYKNRPFHLGLHKMESLKRVDKPTTLIDKDKVPRVPKRNDMFFRAALGDLGPKAQKEMENVRMQTKSPFGNAFGPPLGAMVPLQYGSAAEEVANNTHDAEENSKAIKAALYYMGADMVGMCEIPDYAWYSHNLDGSVIEPGHKNAIAILIDQGYETMEGASGDDWISGAQSMRAYFRAQVAACVGGSIPPLATIISIT